MISNIQAIFNVYTKFWRPQKFGAIRYEATANNLDENQPWKKKLDILWDPDPWTIILSGITTNSLPFISYWPCGKTVRSDTSLPTNYEYQEQEHALGHLQYHQSTATMGNWWLVDFHLLLISKICSSPIIQNTGTLYTCAKISFNPFKSKRGFGCACVCVYCCRLRSFC